MVFWIHDAIMNYAVVDAPHVSVATSRPTDYMFTSTLFRVA